MNNFFCTVFISVGLLLLINSNNNLNNKIKGGTNMLNIYNNKLKPCGNKKMSNGSWDNKKLCSEKNNGVHQICIKNISKNTPNFSIITGQSNWSDNRNDNNHCVCLGAWSLYNKKLNIEKYNNKKPKKSKKSKKPKKSKNILKCDSIPKISLSDKYVSNFSEGWNKWNGLELNNQIVDGVQGMVEDCLNTTNKKKKNLINNYCNFSKKHKSLNNTTFYKKHCI